MEFVKALVRFVAWSVSCAFPRRRTKLVFGAWEGKSYSDNAKYVFEHFFNKDCFRVVWVGNEAVRDSMPPLPRNASFARKGSLISFWHLLTAKYWMFTHSACDFSQLPLYGNAVHVNLGHGSFGIKKWGDARACVAGCCKARNLLIDGINSIVRPREMFLVVGNHLFMEQFRKSYLGLDRIEELPFGTATLDFLLANKDNKIIRRELKQRIASDFNLPIDKKWIVYAPTFRWLKKNNFSFEDLKGRDIIRLKDILARDNAIIIEKLHPGCLSEKCHMGAESGFVFSISGKKALQIDQNYLWLIADLCISDYSAVIYLSYFSGNPVIHFAYDLDFYMNHDTGLNYLMEDIKVGPIAYTTNELIDLLAVGVRRMNIDETGKMVPVLFEYEKGNTCKEIEGFLRRRLKI